MPKTTKEIIDNYIDWDTMKIHSCDDKWYSESELYQAKRDERETIFQIIDAEIEDWQNTFFEDKELVVDTLERIKSRWATAIN